MNMKTSRLTIIVLFILSLNVLPARAGDIFDDLASMDKDMYVHFSAGVVVSHAAYPLFCHYLHDRKKAMWYAVAVSALLSLGKELYDGPRSGFNGGELAAGVAGGCTLFVVTFD